MKLTIHLKLKPTLEQAVALTQTLERANAACDLISQLAWDAPTFKQFAMHNLASYTVREQSGLAAQVVVGWIAKVADAYKLDRTVKRTFQPRGAVAFDERILSYTAATVSIWTVDGRHTIPFVCGARQRAVLPTRRGETDLVHVRGAWYVFATCEGEEPEPLAVAGVLGVDLGIVKLATDSDGEQHSGAQVKAVRERRFQHRKRLQRANTRRARWRLRTVAGREHRFQKDVNHRISKQLVEKACASHKALALADVTHIRQRTDTTARREQRRTRTSWAFAQLRQFVAYKAHLVGVPVLVVDPRNTSRTCSVCGHCEHANRQRQSSFVCRRCGFQANADGNAAVHIARVATINQPIVSLLNHCIESADTSPDALALGR